MLGAALLPGCRQKQSQSSGEGGQTLELALFLGGYTGYWESYIAKFEQENPGITVKYELSNTIHDTLRARMMTDDVPDFIATNIFPQFDPRVLAREGQLLDLSSFFSETQISGIPLRDRIMDGLLDPGTFNGKAYLAPQLFNMQGLFYNKKLLRDLGVEAPETWDEFIAIGDRLAASDMKGVSLFVYSGIDVAYVFSMMAMPSLGGVWNDIIANKPWVWTSPEVVKLLGYYRTMGDKKFVQPGSLGLDYLQSQADFLTGKALFHANGDWLENEMADVEPVNFEWGFIPSLKLNPKDSAYLFTNIEAMYIPAKAKNPELAKKFLAGVYGDDSVRLIGQNSGAVIPVKGAVNLVSDYLSTSFKEMLAGQERTGAISKDFNLPPELLPVGDEGGNQLNNLMDASITPERAASAMEAVAAGLRQ
jgi:N-acetylglucosamine transport system substrate-binding protein